MGNLKNADLLEEAERLRARMAEMLAERAELIVQLSLQTNDNYEGLDFGQLYNRTIMELKEKE